MGEKLEITSDVVIPDKHYGILTKDGVFCQELNPGKYNPNKHLNEEIIMYKEVLITENQFGIYVEDGRFIKLLSPGTYRENKLRFIQIVVNDLTIIDEGFCGIQYIDGNVKITLGPGKYCENHLQREKIVLVDMRTITKELKPQEVTSKDGVGMIIHSILVYQIIDALKAICRVGDIDFTIREIIKGIQHQVLSEHGVEYILSNKVNISKNIQERVAENCVEFGITIKHIDIKDICFDDALKESLASSAIAFRIGQSKILTADAEILVAEKMRMVAELMASPAAAHMRECELLREMSKNGKTKILFVPQIGRSGQINTIDSDTMSRVLAHHIVNDANEE